MKVNELVQRYGPIVGRILLAAIFIVAGMNKLLNFGGTVAYMESAGLPMVEVLLVATIVIELGGGLMIALAWNARWAALAIFLFIIPVTLIFHDFWTVEGQEMQNQLNHFMKNLAIMGGMLYVIVMGSGPYSGSGAVPAGP
ncbi:MAG: DoxX family protein [Gammaproteobacteria bacterium]|nr:DoxX family protein [Gammaproteobacteria bacterium]